MRVLLGWIGRHLIFLVVIVAILVAGNAFREQLHEFTELKIEHGFLSKRQDILAKNLRQEVDAAKWRVESLDRDVEDKLALRLKTIRSEIAELKRQRGDLKTATLDILKGEVLEKAKGEIKIAVLQKEEGFVQGLLDRLISFRGAYAVLERRREVHEAVFAQLRVNEAQQEVVKANYPLWKRLPGTQASRQLSQLKTDHDDLLKSNLAAHISYQEQLARVQGMPAPEPPAPFALSEHEVLATLKAEVSDIKRRLDSNWASILSKPVKEVLPAAVVILVGIVFGPIAIKIFLYYVVAPLASKRPSVQIVPEARGELGLGDHRRPVPGEGSISAISHEVTIGPSEEMLVHPGYLQSTADAASKRTKWLLDWSLPFVSLASGMVALTRIRSNSDQSFVVSAMKDPLSEVGLISVPRLGAVVLQPRSLVGVIQPLDCPVRITRHWRLGSVNAWLTLQLRYLVFRGPVTLIVKGCRGVRVEMPTTGRSINQAATMGFSANLAYSVRRYETFMPYAFGKQDLFNDSFAGGPGFCIYEESPNFGKGGGITGRGLEGILDSMLKVFGI